MGRFVCRYCREKFRTQAGMRIHRTRVHSRRKATIQDRRQQQLKNGNGLEKFFKTILRNLQVRFSCQFELCGRLFDFYLPDFNTAIEVDGDYWHCNPKIYPEPINELQRIVILNDKRKNQLCKKNGILLLRYWEFDIYHNTEWVKWDLKRKLGLY